MVDEDLVRKKLAFIETCVQELRTLAKPDRIDHDVREERFVAHTLQLAIQAALDTASHIVSDRRLALLLLSDQFRTGIETWARNRT